MFPTASQCNFFPAERKFPTRFPQHTEPAGNKTGKIQVIHQGRHFFLAVTRNGWFSLFPLDSVAETRAAAIIIRQEYYDFVFHTIEELAKFLNMPVPGKQEPTIYKTMYDLKTQQYITSIQSGESDLIFKSNEKHKTILF